MKITLCGLFLSLVFLGLTCTRAAADMSGGNARPGPSLAQCNSQLDTTSKELELAQVEIERLNAVLKDKDGQIKALQDENTGLKESRPVGVGSLPWWLPWLIALIAAVLAYLIGQRTGKSR